MTLPQLPLLISIILDYQIGFVQCNRTGGTGLSQAGVVCNCVLNGHCQDSKITWQPLLAGASHQVSWLAWHQGGWFMPHVPWDMSRIALWRWFLVALFLTEPSVTQSNSLLYSQLSQSRHLTQLLFTFILNSATRAWSTPQSHPYGWLCGYTEAHRTAGRLCSSLRLMCGRQWEGADGGGGSRARVVPVLGLSVQEAQGTAGEGPA